MIGALVVTHGGVARELVAAVERICGESPQLRAVCIAWEEDVAAARQKIVAAVEAVDRGVGVLILTDMFGGTASNLSLTLLDPGRVEVVTGVNLSMLLKLGTAASSGLSLSEIAELVCARGRESIQIPSRALRRPLRHDGPPGAAGREGSR